MGCKPSKPSRSAEGSDDNGSLRTFSARNSCGTCLIVSISGPQTGVPCTSEARSEPRLPDIASAFIWSGCPRLSVARGAKCGESGHQGQWRVAECSEAKPRIERRRIFVDGVHNDRADRDLLRCAGHG